MFEKQGTVETFDGTVSVMPSMTGLKPGVTIDINSGDKVFLSLTDAKNLAALIEQKCGAVEQEYNRSDG